MKGDGNSVAFEYRIHDSRLGRFLSVDPLTRAYPWNSPYAFAENRVIDGIDLEGREWSGAIVNGRIHISVNVKLTVANSLSISQISAYKQGIDNTFNKMLQLSTGGLVTGEVTFNNSQPNGRLVPSMTIDAQKYSADAKGRIVGAAMEFPGGVKINAYNKDNSLKTPEEIGADASHELAHTLKIDHPFETTQTGDDRLIKVGINSFITTPNTDKNIQYNIMNYSMIKINGQRLGDLWSKKSPLYLTPGQLKLGLKEVINQMHGAGGKGDGDMLYYYGDTPGEPVKEEKK